MKSYGASKSNEADAEKRSAAFHCPELLEALRRRASDEGLLLISEVVAFVRLSKRKIQNDVDAGALACVKFGRAVRFCPEDVYDYIERRRINRRKGSESRSS